MIKLKIHSLAFIISAYFILTSCTSTKNLTYFTGLKDTTMTSQEPYQPKIQAGDEVGIYITSVNPDADLIYNSFALMGKSTMSPSTLSMANSGAGGGAAGANAPAVGGYSVDRNGNVNLPVLGYVHLAGLNTIEATDTLQHILSKRLRMPVVQVKLLSFKVSVLGEVRVPSVYAAAGDHISILEAISMAGDLTIFARKDNVVLIREEGGKRQIFRIDLTSKKLLESPFYYLHNNDIIYVEATKNKLVQNDALLRILPLVISSLSFIAIILTRVL